MAPESSPLPSGLLPLAEIAALANVHGAAALQLPALELLFNHVSLLARANLGVAGEQEYDSDAHLAQCGVSPEVIFAARTARENLGKGLEGGVPEDRLRRAVRDFEHAITARAQEQLNSEQRATVLGTRLQAPELDTHPDRHYRPPEREEEVAMKGVRYGCGCMSVIMMVPVIPAFVEAALSQHIVTRTLDPVMDFEGALVAAAFAIITSAVLSLVYRKLFAKYFEPKVLAVSFVLALALGALAAVGDLADGGKSEQEDINELFEFDGDSK